MAISHKHTHICTHKPELQPGYTLGDLCVPLCTYSRVTLTPKLQSLNVARWSVGNVVQGPQHPDVGKAPAASGPRNAPQRPLGETDRADARRRATARQWSEVSKVGSPVREKWAGDGRGRLGC